MKAHEVKVKDLHDGQRRHLDWRLRTKMGCSVMAAYCIVFGGYTVRWAGHEKKDYYGKSTRECTLFQIFKACGCTDRSAKVQSKKVIDFMRV